MEKIKRGGPYDEKTGGRAGLDAIIVDRVG